MKFTYIGEAPAGEIELYGFIWKPNLPVDVSGAEAWVVDRLSRHPFFVTGDVKPVEQPPVKRGPGRPPKVVTNG